MLKTIRGKNNQLSREFINFFSFIIVSLVVLAFTACVSLKAVASTWLLVDIGIIGTASQDILDSSVRQASLENHKGLIIRLDTPGGSLESTRSMVKTMMASEIPIVVWVGPAGSRAASAGSFITLASHIAAMAPGTNIGAAHPVLIGTNLDDNSEIGRKAEQDTEAFIEAIATTRQRNVEMARSFVKNSISITAEEAKAHKIIDFLANDPRELLSKINNREITINNKKINIDTTNDQIIFFQKTYRQVILEILSNPDIFYLLFLCGLIGLGYEMTHPGLILPGVAGSISLILALVATSILPVHFGALTLMVTGILFMIAEAFVPSFGALGIGGFLAFFVGSIFLVDPYNVEGLRISLFTIFPGAIVIAITFLSLGYLILKSFNSKVISGPESLVGCDCVALNDFQNNRGQVRAQGAIWSAEILNHDDLYSEPVKKDTTLEIVVRKGLILFVKRKEKR